MNKKIRHERKMAKYKKRLRNYQIDDKDGGKYFAFRSHGSPCSCILCSHEKYNRRKQKERGYLIETDFIHKPINRAILDIDTRG